MGEMSSEETSEATARGKGDDAGNPHPLGPSVQHGGEGSLALMSRIRRGCIRRSRVRVERFDSAGIDIDRRFRSEEPRTLFCEFGTWGQGERDIEHCLASGPDEDGGGDAHFDSGADRTGLGRGLASADTSREGRSGKGDDVGARARAARDGERVCFEFGVRSQFGAEGEVGDEETRDAHELD